MMRFARSFSIILPSIIAGSAFLGSAANAQICTRLPLSDVAFGKPAATESAREKLRQYARLELGKRGWSGKGRIRESNEKVSCEVYLNLGLLGTEYRCLVTTTFCTK